MQAEIQFHHVGILRAFRELPVFAYLLGAVKFVDGPVEVRVGVLLDDGQHVI